MSRLAAQSLPESLSRLLDGSELERKVGTVLELVTLDEHGWPHVALLSVGEVLAVSPSELRLALWASSGTSANLRRTGRGLLAVVHDGAYLKVRFSAEPLPAIAAGERTLTAFAAQVAEVDADRVGYATLTGGIGFELDEPGPVLERWRDVVEDLRACG